MAFIPDDAEWYLAELVQETFVQGDPRNVVMQDLTLIRADSPFEAYDKAMRFGRNGDTEYDDSEGKQVKIRFRGLSHLEVIHDKLEDGAEISFTSKLGLAEDDITALIRRKEELSVFSELRRMDGPDFASGEIIREIEEQFGVTQAKVVAIGGGGFPSRPTNNRRNARADAGTIATARATADSLRE